MRAIDRFPEGVFLIDFEFHPRAHKEGNAPHPVCLVVREYITGKVWRYWLDELQAMRKAPFPCGGGALVVAYFASAEMDCFLALDWQLPVNLLDLFVEFRCRTNGQSTPHGASLIGALSHLGFPTMEYAHKEQMRALVLGGGPWSPDEQQAILAYCQSDVDAMCPLLRFMYSQIDWPRALLRGRYMKAVACMQATGVPIDTEILQDCVTHWSGIKAQLIAEIDAVYGVFDGETFKVAWWATFLERNNIPWPRLYSGALALDDDTFRQQAKAFPLVAPIRELRSALSEMRLASLTVGDDGRNRCMLSPFASRTGRNQPSNTKFIFGPSVWMRGLIKPPKGLGLAYLDYSQQEFGIAGALSGDTAMQEAYRSGDPYLAFAKQAGAVPEEATKKTHKSEREQFKACVLAVQYGMGPEALAQRIGQPVIRARHLLELHRRTYPKFWKWSDAAVNEADLNGRLWTVFGWELRPSHPFNPRSLRNFPMQANGAEMLRLACIYLTDAGIRVCAPVHDALLIEAPLDNLDDAVAQAQKLMAQASADVLDGFELNSDARIVRYPDRYMDERGEVMWGKVMGLIDRAKSTPLAACLG
jgi:DNA polymerase-1